MIDKGNIFSNGWNCFPEVSIQNESEGGRLALDSWTSKFSPTEIVLTMNIFAPDAMFEYILNPFEDTKANFAAMIWMSPWVQLCFSDRIESTTDDNRQQENDAFNSPRSYCNNAVRSYLLFAREMMRKSPVAFTLLLAEKVIFFPKYTCSASAKDDQKDGVRNCRTCSNEELIAMGFAPTEDNKEIMDTIGIINCMITTASDDAYHFNWGMASKKEFGERVSFLIKQSLRNAGMDETDLIPLIGEKALQYIIPAWIFGTRYGYIGNAEPLSTWREFAAHFLDDTSSYWEGQEIIDWITELIVRRYHSHHQSTQALLHLIEGMLKSRYMHVRRLAPMLILQNFGKYHKAELLSIVVSLRDSFLFSLGQIHHNRASYLAGSFFLKAAKSSRVKMNLIYVKQNLLDSIEIVPAIFAPSLARVQRENHISIPSMLFFLGVSAEQMFTLLDLYVEVDMQRISLDNNISVDEFLYHALPKSYENGIFPNFIARWANYPGIKSLTNSNDQYKTLLTMLVSDEDGVELYDYNDLAFWQGEDIKDDDKSTAYSEKYMNDISRLNDFLDWWVDGYRNALEVNAKLFGEETGKYLRGLIALGMPVFAFWARKGLARVISKRHLKVHADLMRAYIDGFLHSMNLNHMIEIMSIADAQVIVASGENSSSDNVTVGDIFRERVSLLWPTFTKDKKRKLFILMPISMWTEEMYDELTEKLIEVPKDEKQEIRMADWERIYKEYKNIPEITDMSDKQKKAVMTMAHQMLSDYRNRLNSGFSPDIPTPIIATINGRPLHTIFTPKSLAEYWESMRYSHMVQGYCFLDQVPISPIKNRPFANQMNAPFLMIDDNAEMISDIVEEAGQTLSQSSQAIDGIDTIEDYWHKQYVENALRILILIQHLTKDCCPDLVKKAVKKWSPDAAANITAYSYYSLADYEEEKRWYQTIKESIEEEEQV